MAFEIRCLQVSHIERRHLTKDMRERREVAMQTPGERMFQAERTEGKSPYFRSKKEVTTDRGE